jgi:hypothetical protein
MLFPEFVSVINMTGQGLPSIYWTGIPLAEISFYWLIVNSQTL